MDYVTILTTPSGQLYRDKEILHTYRDFAKTHANPDTLRYRSGQAHGNSLNRRAVMGNRADIKQYAIESIS